MCSSDLVRVIAPRAKLVREHLLPSAREPEVGVTLPPEGRSRSWKTSRDISRRGSQSTVDLTKAEMSFGGTVAHPEGGWLDGWSTSDEYSGVMSTLAFTRLGPTWAGGFALRRAQLPGEGYDTAG